MLIDEDAVIREAVAGEPVRLIAQRQGCSQEAVKAVLDRRAAEMLTPAARARQLMLELNRLDHLAAVFHRHAVANQDAAAGTLVVKIAQRKSALLGLDQPAQLRVDLSAVPAQQDGKTNTQRMLEAIRALRSEAEPAKDDDEEPPADKVN
jgi:hypothetical protein